MSQADQEAISKIVESQRDEFSAGCIKSLAFKAGVDVSKQSGKLVQLALSKMVRAGDVVMVQKHRSGSYARPAIYRVQ